jgi:comEA protein
MNGADNLLRKQGGPTSPLETGLCRAFTSSWRTAMRRILIAIAILATVGVAHPSIAAPQAAKAGASAAKAKATASNPVNLNSASVAQLQTLPGIGASAAQRIIEYRQKNGSFKKIEELMNVKGIGEKSFLKLKPLITVAADKGDRAGAEK